MVLKHVDKYKQLGLNISFYRKATGMTQVQLAERADISRTYLSNIEAPNVIIPFTTTVLFNISDALGVELNKLFTP